MKGPDVHMVYRLYDEAGQVVYIGRTNNLVNRLRSHYGELVTTDPTRNRSTWLTEVRTLDALGPFTRDEAKRVERQEIETHQPRANRVFTKKAGWRPLSEGGGWYGSLTTALTVVPDVSA